MNPHYAELVQRSKEALGDPQPGDCWHEMFSWWLFVTSRDGDLMTTLELNPPGTFPDDGKFWSGSVEEFKKRMSYGTIPGTWAKCDSRGNDVSGWVPKTAWSRVNKLFTEEK
jgi:hypothetical protein